MNELKQYKERINQKLTEQLTQLKLPQNKASESIKERLLPYATSGKCIRGSLVLLTHNIYGGNKEKEAIEAAAALELLQAMVLIIDDIIDKDTMRRGQTTIHTQFKEQVNDQHYGEGLANCLSVITTMQAMSLLQHQPQEIIDLISYEMTLCGLGEMQEIYHTLSQKGTQEEILEVYTLKTAHYTFNLPIAIGAILAGVDPKEQESLWNMAENLGILFQIQDDLLELHSTPEELGKSKTDDDNNTVTIPKLLGEEKAKQLVEEYKQKTIEQLNNLQQKEIFEKFLEYLLNRKK